jgi:integrase
MKNIEKTEETITAQRGNISRKPGSSKLYVDLRYYGRRIVKSTGLPDTPENREKASAFLAQVINKIDANTFNFADAFPNASAKEKATFAQLEDWDYKPEPKNVLIGTYINSWMARIWDKFDSESKKRDYKSIIDYWIVPFYAEKTFAKFTKVQLKEFISSLKQKDGPKAGKNLSRSRCNNILLPLKDIWYDACDEYNWNLRDPFFMISKKLPKKPSSKKVAQKRKVFRFDELMLVLDKIKPQYRLATEFMLRTGSIGSEVAGLRKSDIVGDYIFFRNSIVRKKEKEELKTEYRDREFPISVGLRKVIDTAIAQTEGEYLFLTPTGLNFSEGTYRKNGWTPSLKRAGLEYCVPYSLRHTFAAWCLAINMHPDRLVNLMGHGSRKMVYEVYGSYRQGLEADAENILKYFGQDFIEPSE